MVVTTKMPQRFKSVYYPDHPASTSEGKHLRLAFGPKHSDLFQAINPLTSTELRNALGFGTFSELVAASQRARQSLNALCLSRLREGLHSNTPAASQLLFDPLQATFRGGEHEPLHEWFPLIEGYSPHFVQRILREFCPDAESVLDPFAGIGTTPLTAAGMGIQSFYCEINPLLQVLIEVKSQVLTAKENTRYILSEELDQLRSSIQDSLLECAPDSDLRLSYRLTFGLSKFFGDEIFEQILRARTLVDRISCESSLLSSLLLTAVLKSFVPSSLLIRAGDLRFRNPGELKRSKQDFVAEVQQNLVQIADDLLRVSSITNRPVLLTEDAKNLGTLDSLNVDGVITSPPYLNGTNYARNTKIELWFLRCLQDSTDLSFLRQRSVTAGINDVVKSKNGTKHPEVARLVKSLERQAYDPRIPKMVSMYFSDLSQVFDGVLHHLKPGGVLAVDIGDSAYAGLRVSTDSLLDTTLREKGFLPLRRVVLRRRTSRSGMVLQQALLVYRAPEKPRRIRLPKPEYWVDSWESFKRALPHQTSPFSSRNWGHPLHSLCSYQGKMKPSLAHFLIKTFFRPGSKILDPFAGVGTIPFEAALNGMETFGFEISPAAWAIAAAKLARSDSPKIFALIEKLAAYLEKETTRQNELQCADTINFNGKISEYFEPGTLREILLARRFFLLNPPRDPAACFVFASLLHILHGNRPYALSRRSHPITPFAPTGTFEYRPLVLRLKEKVRRGLEVELPLGFVEGRMFFQDATLWWPSEVNDLDGILTSPPFFDSTRFYSANWMRLWFSGWELADFRSRPLSFVEEQQKHSFAIYQSVFRQARERLKPGGVVVMHLGKSRKCDMAEKLAEVATLWFRVADKFSENVSHCETHGIRDKGTVTEHQFLVLT